MSKKQAAKTKTAKARTIEKTTLQAPRGMHDILPAEQPWWDRVRSVAKEVASTYSFFRIDTPILESADVFKRGAGEATDVVEKEMYTFRTKGGDILALRPEGTAAVARAYLEHGLSKFGQPVKLYYEGSMFRHEKPQAGRFREHRQAGFEIIGGPNDPLYDAQVIIVCSKFFETLKVKNTELKLNSIGCRICRPSYIRQLQGYYRRYEKDLCKDCVERLGANPLRLLDCKSEKCQGIKKEAPIFLDKLCAACSRHLQGVLEYLDELKISYGIDNHLVRGFDYYSRTVFEFDARDSGVGSFAGGGRYDYLIEALGGRFTPAVGGAIGLERVIHIMKLQEIKLPSGAQKKVFMIYVGDQAKKKALRFVEELQRADIGVMENFGKESLKTQLRAADKSGASLALIMGQREIYEESVIIRDLRSGVQEVVILDRVADVIRKKLREKI